MHKPFKPFIENGIRQVLLVCKKSLKDLLYLFERQSESERARGINKGREGGWEGEGGRPSEHSSDWVCVVHWSSFCWLSLPKVVGAPHFIQSATYAKKPEPLATFCSFPRAPLGSHTARGATGTCICVYLRCLHCRQWFNLSHKSVHPMQKYFCKQCSIKFM